MKRTRPAATAMYSKSYVVTVIGPTWKAEKKQRPLTKVPPWAAQVPEVVVEEDAVVVAVVVELIEFEVDEVVELDVDEVVEIEVKLIEVVVKEILVLVVVLVVVLDITVEVVLLNVLEVLVVVVEEVETIVGAIKYK